MVELETRVGSVALRSPVMTASGTAGHGAELGAYGALGELGAVVVKSLAVYPWPGNPAPRVRPVPGGSMLNSVGLQGPGVAEWREHELPALIESGAAVVASIWGRTVQEYEEAATALEGAAGVVSVEVNVSCPNIEDRSRMFAHSAAATADAVAAAAASRLPRWAKLSPNVADVCEIAAAALEAGAESLTLVNTLLGMTVEPASRHYGRRDADAAGDGGAAFRAMPGGLSGTALHPVAIRAVYECRRAFPDAAIVGAGGIATGGDAVEMLAAGADAVQVGTATFADPRAPWKVQDELARWCAGRGVSVRELVGAAVR